MTERITVIQGVRLTPSDAETLRVLAGPRGGSKLIRQLIRAEAARRQIIGAEGPERK